MYLNKVTLFLLHLCMLIDDLICGTFKRYAYCLNAWVPRPQSCLAGTLSSFECWFWRRYVSWLTNESRLSEPADRSTKHWCLCRGVTTKDHTPCRPHSRRERLTDPCARRPDSLFHVLIIHPHRSYCTVEVQNHYARKLAECDKIISISVYRAF